MAQPYIAQILIAGFNFAPINYAFCNGQLMAISQNEALFSLVGTTYGGDGVTTYGLPNFQERGVVNIGQGPGLSNYDLGEQTGAANVTLNIGQIPQHNHLVTGYPGTAYSPTPINNGWIGDQVQGGRIFSALNTVDQSMAQTVLINNGGSQPHSNEQPYLVLNYVIALYGIFPSRN